MAGSHRPDRAVLGGEVVMSTVDQPHPDAATAGGVWPDWRAVVAAKDTGPDLVVLHESAALKVVLVALAAGQALPEHPGPAASFHILDGTGSVIVDGVEHPVSAGATVIAPPETHRAVRATSPLVFLGNLGDPASEDELQG